MALTLRIPKAAVSMQEGTIAEWLVPDGAQVVEGQPIFTLEIEKSTMDVEAPAAGILRQIAKAGDTHKVGTVIGEIADAPVAASTPEAAPAAAAGSAPYAGPRDARSLGLAFLQAFWDGDVGRGFALCAPDAKWRFQKTLHAPQEVPVREAVSFLMSALVSGFAPDSGYQVQFRNAVAEGDEAAFEYDASGRTVRGELYSNNYLVRMTVRDGWIVSIRPYFDTHLVSRMLYSLD
jgi:pyruvate/2-oxoglutarate dehydrogenase complex dihydrolipoamide acyltransferase (E2) component